MSARKVEIKWDEVDAMLKAQCSGVAIAGILGIHENTLYDRCRADHSMEFSEYSRRKKTEGRELLRLSMFNEAMAGGTTMKIWLSKQYLDMKDRHDVEQRMSLFDYIKELETSDPEGDSQDDEPSAKD